MDKLCSIRDVVYGFITLDPQEQEIINHQAFQRLRRIKQLALTDMVYPGAGHTRFEHSLGVMQMATEMYNNIVLTKKELLVNDFKIQDSGINRNRKIIDWRFAARYWTSPLLSCRRRTDGTAARVLYVLFKI
jgi:HD superfamily phosphohydrolase